MRKKDSDNKMNVKKFIGELEIIINDLKSSDPKLSLSSHRIESILNDMNKYRLLIESLQEFIKVGTKLIQKDGTYVVEEYFDRKNKKVNTEEFDQTYIARPIKKHGHYGECSKACVMGMLIDKRDEVLSLIERLSKDYSLVSEGPSYCSISPNKLNTYEDPFVLLNDIFSAIKDFRGIENECDDFYRFLSDEGRYCDIEFYKDFKISKKIGEIYGDFERFKYKYIKQFSEFPKYLPANTYHKVIDIDMDLILEKLDEIYKSRDQKDTENT